MRKLKIMKNINNELLKKKLKLKMKQKKLRKKQRKTTVPKMRKLRN